jgi:hypothetical protein
VILTKYISSDKIEMLEMNRACSTCGGEEKCIEGFGRDTLGKETT